MQSLNRLSLNAVRVFEVAARLGSLKAAASELAVTPSAVSHQIKTLEDALGVSLFRRRNNAVALSDAGRRFYADAAPGIAMIVQSAKALRRSADELVVRASVSVAVRWLIPVLEAFKPQWPGVHIRLETTHMAQAELTPAVDLALGYLRRGQSAGEAELLIRDIRRPVLAPGLLADSPYRGFADIDCLPALSGWEVDWDWHAWSSAAGLDPDRIRPVHAFDTDDAAIHGAVAGLGMVLAPPFMTMREVSMGTLVALPDAPAIELGGYWLLSNKRPRRVVEKFHAWLREKALD